MEQAQGQAFRRFGVLAIVLSGHVLLVMLLSSSRSSDTRKGLARAEPYTVLELLDLKQTPETPAAVSADRTRAERARKSPSAAPSEPSDETNHSTAIGSEESGVLPKIDWQREREIAVAAVAPKVTKDYVRLCAQAERTHAPRPPGCNRRSFEGPWRPTGNWALDMYDPDRPRESVPDPLPEAFPKAPQSEVFQNDE